MASQERWCVVTGGRGFAARHLVEMLIRYEMFCVKIADLHPSISLEPYEEEGTLGKALKSGRARYVSVDLRDKAQVLTAFRGAEVVFHMAAPNSSINNYKLQHSVNVEGTKNVIDACVELQIKRLIYTSSPSVVFDGVHGIINGDESLSYPAKLGKRKLLNSFMHLPRRLSCSNVWGRTKETFWFPSKTYFGQQPGGGGGKGGGTTPRASVTWCRDLVSALDVSKKARLTISALNSHKATFSGGSSEVLLPLPFSEIFKTSYAFPTISKSKDLLSIATNLLQPPLILMSLSKRAKRHRPLSEAAAARSDKTYKPDPKALQTPLLSRKKPEIGTPKVPATSVEASEGWKPERDEQNWERTTLLRRGRSPATGSPVETSPAVTEKAGTRNTSPNQVRNPKNKSRSEEKTRRTTEEDNRPPVSKVDGGSQRPKVQRTPGGPSMTHHNDSYSATKAEGEALVLKANGENGLLTCCIRPSSIFGPGDRLLVPSLVDAARAGKSKLFALVDNGQFIIGDGNNMYDFTYVENVAHAHICAERALASKGEVAEKASGQAYFITNMEPIKFWEFMSLILEGLGYERPRIKIPAVLMMPIAHLVEFMYKLFASYGMKVPQLTPSRIRLLSCNRTFNCSKAKDRLGYTPIVSLQEGIERTIESYSHLRAEHQPKRDGQSKIHRYLGGGKAFYYNFIASGYTMVATASKLVLMAAVFLYIHANLPEKIFGRVIEKVPVSAFHGSEEKSRRAAHSAVSVWNNSVGVLKSLCSGNDWILFLKVVITLVLVSFLGALSLQRLFLAGILFAFGAFYVYEKKEEEIDTLFSKAANFVRSNSSAAGSQKRGPTE
ncbi:hypothetical protein Cgig2_003445 [Carnegiea gigantea]|uniref:Reticulon-like protein n=1 Tax=Carnegiea gigantea TaxID=171969 RepID=A0A9Q1KAX3_9CARY|nr:hypothetical protein Cgig2_003445 [Carnegiea gigantea]